ncbi:uncharacterized protein ANIA_00650 [Aspergillus nidulans FGSC A4]|uniref:Synaptobrevin n=1 Tax=Emericella nidulans (strain FGSC A4 / ATCC 38163 / CBS 112.46 / NRRL 194 / M139) TaxID=227321 RepID=C8VS03_EMENI|nr:hypothetical protein [Aspergillus nidulans FGSC A4]CBF89058.1 TPA: conserved hypothetical protein [Aspergillus nidulans FGSC A4]
MRSENDHPNLFKDSGNSRLGIVYPIICIICALLLARRIRHRQRTKYILPRGQMDTPSEKHGGKQSPGLSDPELSYSTRDIHHRLPLPSACDILHPLSHSTSLPSSGYLAAVLIEDRKQKMDQAYQLEGECTSPTSPDCTTVGESALVGLRTDCNLLSGTVNPPTPTDDSSQATSLPTRRSTDVADRQHPNSLDFGASWSVQKRGEHVEFLRDVDEEGARTWRRLLKPTADLAAATRQTRNNTAVYLCTSECPTSRKRPSSAPLAIAAKKLPRGKSQTTLPRTLRLSPSSPKSSNEMTLTTYPATTDPSDLAALNLSRLVDRLEFNILSPNADLKSLRRSEYQRIRVGVNIEYARATLQALERSLPQIKPVDRRHELQSSLSRNRQTLKQVQNVLDEIQAEEESRVSARGDEWDLGEDEDDEDADSEGDDLLRTPDTAGEATPEDSFEAPEAAREKSDIDVPATTIVDAGSSPSPTSTAPVPGPALRNRHQNIATASSPTSNLKPTATATGTSLHDAAKTSEPQTADTEEALATDRLEQENLTSSLLDLATQLKTSSQQFQASLEAEKSVLARAAEGLDRTTGNLAAAERRMGMLRRMTEGKGWWGRMMLYAWIFALVARFLGVLGVPSLLKAINSPFYSGVIACYITTEQPERDTGKERITILNFAYIVFALSNTSKRVGRCGIYHYPIRKQTKKGTGEKDKGHPRQRHGMVAGTSSDTVSEG